MKIMIKYALKKFVLTILFLLTFSSSYSQVQNPAVQKSDFWQKVQFGGGLGLTFGNFTEVTIAPAAIYRVNSSFAIGPSVQYSYISSRDFFKSTMYGASIMTLYNPVPSIQLSLEAEQMKVDRTILTVTPNTNDKFWNTAVFVGGGYSIGRVVVGGRYNLLFNQDRNVYGTAFMPFVRAFF